MVSAHMDEVGFMVRFCDSDGYIKFSSVGGIDKKVLPSKRVKLFSKGEMLPGVITSKAIHLQKKEERGTPVDIDDMFIDIGAKDKEDIEKYVNIGDYGVFDSDFVEFGDGFIKGKALDDRFGCAIMLEVIDMLKDKEDELQISLCMAFTVREELGLSGAATAAHIVNPDYSIVLETTAVADVAGVPDNKKVANLKEGGVISIADRGTVYNKELIDFAFECAKKDSIKCQVKRYVSGGNDAATIQKIGDGVKVLAISAPARYIHSASNVIAKDDYDSIRDLTFSMLTKFNLCKREEK